MQPPVETEGKASASRAPISFGNYLLVHRLAAGGMGQIYLALQKQSLSKRLVAVKVQGHTTLDEEYMLSMFIDEARASANLQHPNIVSVFEVAQVNDVPYIAMEYIEGSNLGAIRRRLKDKGTRPPVHIVARIFLETARALAYAHKSGLIHRDVSPPNILVSDEGGLKLIDFGVAKGSTGTATVPGQVKGKYAYMAPEYVKGNEATPACDIFSLGVVIHELLTCKRLFAGSSAGVVIASVLHDPIVSPVSDVPDLPAELDELLMRCLSRDPTERPSAEDLIERLEGIIADLSTKGMQLPKWHSELMADAIAKRHELRQRLLGLDVGELEAVAVPLDQVTIIEDDEAARLRTGAQSSRNLHASGASERSRSTGAHARSSPQSASLEGVQAPSTVTEAATPRHRRVALGVGALLLLALGTGLASRSRGTEPATASAPPAASASPKESESDVRRRAGMQAMAARDYPKAVTELEAAIKLGSHDPDVAQMLSQALASSREEQGSKASPPASASGAPVATAPAPRAIAPGFVRYAPPAAKRGHEVSATTTPVATPPASTSADDKAPAKAKETTPAVQIIQDDGIKVID